MRRSFPRSLQLANAADGELQADSALDEKWEAACVWIVIAGLVLEGVVAGLHAPYDSAVTRWGSFVCDALIALGVYFELFFSNRIRQRDHELVRRSNERVAKAEQEAARANYRAWEIERVAAWRRITSEQHRKLVDAMRQIAPSLDVLIEYQMNDPEAYTYAQEIIKAFQEAGVTNIRSNSNAFLGTPVFGLYLFADRPLEFDSFDKIFSTAGIDIAIIGVAPDAVVRSDPKPNVYTFVAPKPPPSTVR